VKKIFFGFRAALSMIVPG